MEDIKLYLSIIIFVLGLITSIVSIVIKHIKNVNTKKKLENILSIMEDLIPLIEEAEKFVSYSGEEKKEYVISRIIRNLNNDGKLIDEQQINDMIEKLVSFTKKVNSTKGNISSNESKILLRLN